MKKLTIILFIAVIAFAGCKKGTSFDPVKQAAADDATIQAYIKTNNLQGVNKDPSGLYYQIITQGTGVNATAVSTVTVNYTGTLLDGTVFDTTTGKSAFTSPLDQVIAGWKIGVPLVKAGGRILLIIPSGLGYGNNAAGTIPANSVLLFTIDVITVK